MSTPAKETQRERVLNALLTHTTVQAAAESIGLPLRTMYSVMAKAEFKEELREHRQKVVEASCTALQTNMGKATDVLVEIMHDETQPARDRVAAARSIIEFGIESAKFVDILPRLEALEKASTMQNM